MAQVMPRLFLALLPALLLAAPADAAMTVGTFLSRAQPLRDQGMLAVLNPDFPVLKGEADAATRALRAEAAQRRAAGKKPVACVPDGQGIGITEMLDELDALPPAAKRLPLKDGYARVLARRFPC
jgi:hypothetical protein